ncbi:MAG TPA: hypothetical protein VHT91_49735 [Kofleriaceae bacterium]|nr:hypothetical protein [Kofleriaceae bacterium]
MPSDRAQIHILVPLFAIGFVVVNAAFFLMSGSYFASHHQIVGGASVPTFSPDQASHIRVAFAAMSGAVAAIGFVASLARRAIGHLLAALLGVANLVFGILALTHSQPGALTATLLVTGCVVPVLAYLSYRGVRAAWAFLAALCGVLAVVGLFGAPKISRALDVSLWTTMIFPGLYVVACATLARLHDDYLEPAAARRA